jgi:hypothetical protein
MTCPEDVCLSSTVPCHLVSERFDFSRFLAKRLKSFVAVRYPSQQVADNPDTRATGEQERLTHLKDGREEEGRELRS